MLVLLAVGALVRIINAIRIVMWNYLPFGGDPTYLDDSRKILLFDFHGLGDRAPVYPLLLALCGLNGWVVYLAQSIFGLAVSLMIFDMAFRRTRQGPLSA
jgi:hypothetical protein